MKAVLNLANTPQFIDNYPHDNMSREIDFADFSAIGAALEEIYGLRGERGLGLHAGKTCFSQGVNDFGSISGLGELTFKAIPFNTKLKIGLKAMAEAFDKFSDQVTTVGESDEYYIYTIHRCPVCWGRTSSKPICYVAAGTIQGGLHWFTGGLEFHVEEVACIAKGDEACVFHIGKESIS
jgi:predicted hydrocarbon binding protein